MRDDKLFVVRKYVMARTAAAAIRREKKVEVTDVWLDEEWTAAAKVRPDNESTSRIGF